MGDGAAALCGAEVGLVGGTVDSIVASRAEASAASSAARLTSALGRPSRPTAAPPAALADRSARRLVAIHSVAAGAFAASPRIGGSRSGREARGPSAAHHRSSTLPWVV